MRHTGTYNYSMANATHTNDRNTGGSIMREKTIKRCPTCKSDNVVADATVPCEWNGHAWVPRCKVIPESGDTAFCFDCNSRHAVRDLIEA